MFEMYKGEFSCLLEQNIYTNRVGVLFRMATETGEMKRIPGYK